MHDNDPKCKTKENNGLEWHRSIILLKTSAQKIPSQFERSEHFSKDERNKNAKSRLPISLVDSRLNAVKQAKDGLAEY